jgi:diguanylate cyclase (GGDEF)-like protein/PAS domain S-box-containing protein
VRRRRPALNVTDAAPIFTMWTETSTWCRVTRPPGRRRHRRTTSRRWPRRASAHSSSCPPTPVFVIVDGYHAFANARGIELLGGRTLADIRSQPALDFIHPSMRGTSARRMSDMIERRQQIGHVEERILRLDGTVVDIEAAGTPIGVNDRVGALVVVREITARKQAEARLAAAQERFYAAFRHAPSGMAIVDDNGRFVDANPTLADMVGVSTVELLGRELTSIISVEDRPAAESALARLRSGAASARRGQLRYRREDGTVGWLDLSAAALSGTATYVVHALDISEHKQAEADLTRRALHDPLTGLANRQAVTDAIDEALEGPQPSVAVLFVDLDGFKQVNDELGHAAGDALLQEIGNRLRAAVRPRDLVGRLGGDEFAVVLREPARVAALDVGLRVENAIAAPFRLGAFECRLTASVGSARAGRDGSTSETLLAAADAGMYAAKSARTWRRVVTRVETPPSGGATQQ